MINKRGGIYWSKPTAEARTKLSKWDIVILNDANTFSNPEQPNAHKFIDELKVLNPKIRIGISVNAYSVMVDAQGKPSVYFPAQCEIWEAANKYNAWVLKADGSHVMGWGRSWIFDVRNVSFRNKVAAIFTEYLKQYPAVDFVHYDELHYTWRFNADLAHIPDAEVEAANHAMVSAVPYKVMCNGSFDVTSHFPIKSRGRYLQNAVDPLPSISMIESDLRLNPLNRYTIINPSGAKAFANINEWRAICALFGASMQMFPNGAENQYHQPNIL